MFNKLPIFKMILFLIGNTVPTITLPANSIAALGKLHQDLTSLTRTLKQTEEQPIIVRAKKVLEEAKDAASGSHGSVSFKNFMVLLAHAYSDNDFENITNLIQEECQKIQKVRKDLEKLPQQTETIKSLHKELKNQIDQILANWNKALKTTEYKEAGNPVPFSHPYFNPKQVAEQFPIKIE